MPGQGGTAPIISVRSIGKRYRLGGARLPYKSLRDAIGRSVRRPAAASADPWIWALRDISFDIAEGDVIGIVGRNGAGKSTLLKILSRITEPTTGEAHVHGRVGSLLEVGTGFHPELTGRENIYLNAAILGMRRTEIDRRFDEIVDFAGTERFLETPVKFYSSGMQMRLAFSVAAHIDSEVLLVDEVLAVGDLEFQRKCLGKMQDVSRSGRTVVFVSHNLQAVRTLCETGVLLDQGRVVVHGLIDEVVERYVRLGASTPVGGLLGPAAHLVEPRHFELESVELLGRGGQPAASLLMDEDFAVRIRFRVHDLAREYRIGVWIRTSDGTRLVSFVSTDGGAPHLRARTGDPLTIQMHARNAFPPGTYSLEVLAKDRFGDYVDHVEGLTFGVEPVALGDEPELVARSAAPSWGLVHLPSRWSIPQEILE